MRDARTLAEIPELWRKEAAFWRNTPFRWERWRPPHDGWTHDHCRFCNAYVTDWRDRDPYDKPGPVDGGCYRWAYHAEADDGVSIWVCRTCFKRVKQEFGWTVTPRTARPG